MPLKLYAWLMLAADHEIYRHHEVLAGRLDHMADVVISKPHLGSAIYLALHGLCKVILIYGIFKEKKWGYVGLIGVLSFFAIVELGRAVLHHEILVGVLAVFDLVLVGLIAWEYKKKLQGGARPGPEATP